MVQDWNDRFKGSGRSRVINQLDDLGEGRCRLRVAERQPS
jgi:hypothetical protein